MPTETNLYWVKNSLKYVYKNKGLLLAAFGYRMYIRQYVLIVTHQSIEKKMDRGNKLQMDTLNDYRKIGINYHYE